MFSSYLEKFNLIEIITEDLSKFIQKNFSNPKENFKILKNGGYIKYSSQGNTYYSFLLHTILYNVQYKGSKSVQISFYAKEYPDLTLAIFQDIKIQDLEMKPINLLEMGVSQEFWEKMKVIFLDYSKTNPDAIFNFHGIDVDYEKGKRLRFLIKQRKHFIENEASNIFYQKLLKLQEVEKISVTTQILEKLNDALQYVIMPGLKNNAEIISYFPLLKNLNSDTLDEIYFDKIFDEIWNTYEKSEKEIKDLKSFSTIEETIRNLILSRFINKVISGLKKEKILLPNFFRKYNIISNNIINKYFKGHELDDDDFLYRIQYLRNDIASINISLTLNRQILIEAMENFLKFPKISSILKLRDGLNLNSIISQVSDKELAQYNPAVFRNISFFPKVNATEAIWQFPSTYLEFTQNGIKKLLSGRNLKYYKILKANGINNFIFDGENLSFKLGK